jgi:protein arginine kinase activator
VRIKKEIADLRRKLQEAIGREAYEEAAQIRDEIRAKEEELK